MNLHANVVFKVVLNYSDSTADIVRIYLMLVDHVSNIYGIPTEISHILSECIPLDKYMRLFSLIPVRRIDCDGTTKSAYIFFERVIFDNHHIFIAWNVYKAESLVLLKKAIDISRRFPLCELKRLPKQELAELIDLIARPKLQLLGIWGIAVSVDRVEGCLWVTSVEDIWDVVGVVLESRTHYLYPPSEVLQRHNYPFVCVGCKGWANKTARLISQFSLSCYGKCICLIESVQVLKIAILDKNIRPRLVANGILHVQVSEVELLRIQANQVDIAASVDYHPFTEQGMLEIWIRYQDFASSVGSIILVVVYCFWIRDSSNICCLYNSNPSRAHRLNVD